MKKTILLIGLTMATIAPTFGQGFINFSWFGNGTQGIQIGAQSNPSAQLPGWYLSGDYSVQAYMATGNGAPLASLLPIAAAKTVFIPGGVSTTTAAGGPTADGSGLWQGPVADTGLPLGAATIQVRVWYDPNHSSTFADALAQGVNTGSSALYNINLVDNTSPLVQSLDSVGMAPFTAGVSVVPEPGTFALAGLGAAALLIFRRRK
jgi:hypothetical protein